MAPSILLPSTDDLAKSYDAARPTVTVAKCSHGSKLTVTFPDGVFVFHSQWLYDSRMDGSLGAARNAETAICSQPLAMVCLESACMSQSFSTPVIKVVWDNGASSSFPVEWLRVMGPIVADQSKKRILRPGELDFGWKPSTLAVPEFSYEDIFNTEGSAAKFQDLSLSILDHLLHPKCVGIIKIVDMPAANMQDELNHVNNLNTRVLKKLFGSVFVHPTRGHDKSFNVSSRAAEADKRKELPNYDTNQVLLPHADHAFYEHPINVQGWYILEGTSQNTFVSMSAALQTFQQEDPEAYQALTKTPMALGRVSAFYGEPVFQMTVDTAVSKIPGTNDFKRIRWHPNFTGSLLCQYKDYPDARRAHMKFLEIMRRSDHQLSIKLEPGDFFIWDNFRVLHGREKVFTDPRTGVGQTVTEQVVHDTYRRISIEKISDRIDSQWLVHMPMQQLRELVSLVESQVYRA